MRHSSVNREPSDVLDIKWIVYAAYWISITLKQLVKDSCGSNPPLLLQFGPVCFHSNEIDPMQSLLSSTVRGTGKSQEK